MVPSPDLLAVMHHASDFGFRVTVSYPDIILIHGVDEHERERVLKRYKVGWMKYQDIINDIDSYVEDLTNPYL